ncbi:hypothetical protein GPECTOR_31g318 [Gonium pectorale]|uniref:Reverse transcriptase Ty1/copia-type domain-containing protein n=1 Tax=Gonium pectorale TaxID=33097 RepID=A0A150GDP5_GONPE|nr:hypothetical protein GPECTOR_31g318 [Gonium pectorale]|eukprot:KXZ47956.1 hypothetical protein GPECTOR_31g318 [Gonium pectorale]
MQCQRDGTVSLSQPGYIQKLLDRHSLQNAKPRTTPLPAGARLLPATDTDTLLDDPSSYRALVGELNYLATSTRPDIAQALSGLARHMHRPTKVHMQLALGVLRYLCGTRSFGLRFGGGSATDDIYGYCDSNWACDPQTRRSTTGYAFILNGAAISWSNQLQRTMAASSVEAEYQAASAAVREALWLRKLTPELGLALRPIAISLDSQGALSLAHNPITSARSKHIDVLHHLVRERVRLGDVQLSYCSTEAMVADVLTKPLGEIKFRRCRLALGVVALERPSYIARGARVRIWIIERGRT